MTKKEYYDTPELKNQLTLIPKGFKRLPLGSIIKEGDEYFSVDNTLEKCLSTVGKRYGLNGWVPNYCRAVVIRRIK